MFTNSYFAHWPSRALLAWLLTAVVAFAILLPTPARAQTETVLFSFIYPTFTTTGCPPDSYNAGPYAGLLFYKGHLFGTTPEGGVGEKGVPGTNDGQAFRLTMPKSGKPPWYKKLLHSFIDDPANSAGGLIPCSRLIEKNNVFYGSTLSGGQFGFGTVFSLTPPPEGQSAWAETVLYSFTGGNDGGFPFGGLVMDQNGALYGAGYLSFYSNGGEVFQLICSSTACSENTLLANGNGVIYNGDLLLDPNTGSLFGTASDGGPNRQTGYGNVFQLTPQGDGWTYYDLYDFTGGADGAYPNGGLSGYPPTDIFGTTQGGITGTGDGVLFELRENTAGGPYTLYEQHTFTGSPDGAAPTAGLYLDGSGTFWGTTSSGGADNLGTVFKLYPDRYKIHVWYYDEVYSFAGGLNDGATPESALTGDSNGNLYGTTNQGGSEDEGTVFELTP